MAAIIAHEKKNRGLSGTSNTIFFLILEYPPSLPNPSHNNSHAVIKKNTYMKEFPILRKHSKDVIKFYVCRCCSLVQEEVN